MWQQQQPLALYLIQFNDQNGMVWNLAELCHILPSINTIHRLRSNEYHQFLIFIHIELDEDFIEITPVLNIVFIVLITNIIITLTTIHLKRKNLSVKGVYRMVLPCSNQDPRDGLPLLHLLLQKRALAPRVQSPCPWGRRVQASAMYSHD